MTVNSTVTDATYGPEMLNPLSQQAIDYQRVEDAIRFLETNFQTQPSLDDIAKSVHVSKYHFHRLFKRWAGISPSQFLQFLTIGYAKKKLDESHSLLAVTRDSGLSSPSRLHDLFINFEAVTPGEYKKRGTGVHITYGFHDTPFGACLLATTKRGICGLHFVQRHEESTALESLMQRWPGAQFVEDMSQTQPWVDCIFANVPSHHSRPFHLWVKGTNFQVNVWQALLTIPEGAMVSYEGLATLMGIPNATRAVASAIAKNPVAYLIPCHRVICKAGKIHAYRWGVARKKAILGWEASQHQRDCNHQD